MLFGMQLKNTGIKRYPVRTRQRLIQYAVTLFYKKYDARYGYFVAKNFVLLHKVFTGLSKD